MGEQLININFVKEVEKYPCLYNYKLKEYSKKDIKEKSWEAVGHPFNFSGQEAKDKWKKLRSVFVRELKPPRSGSSKKKKYYLTDAIQFAIPYIKVAGNTSGNLPTTKQPVEQYFQNSLPQSPTSPQPSPTWQPTSLTSLPPSPTPRSSTCTMSPSHQSDQQQASLLSTGSSKKNYKRNKSKLNESDELVNEYIRSKMSKKNKEEEMTINDANKMFLLSLLPEMNSMTQTQARSFKLQVIDLIGNILNSTPSSSAQTSPLILQVHQLTQKCPT